MTTPTLPDSFMATARLCAEAARQNVLPHFRSDLGVDSKGDASPVTRADKSAEQAMRAIIAGRHPEHAILGEEFGLSPHDGDWSWVLDPIDGTRAFITGRPTFATLIALLFRGKPVLGLIDQPLTTERWIGVQGQPTIFESRHLPGTPVTRTGRGIAQAELSCTSPDMMVAPYAVPFQRLKAAALRASWGGDAYGYGLLALGQIDLIAECTMKPWDWAALVPVVEGAGGTITDWSGAALRLDGDGTVLASGCPALHAEAISLLRSSP